MINPKLVLKVTQPEAKPPANDRLFVERPVTKLYPTTKVEGVEIRKRCRVALDGDDVTRDLVSLDLREKMAVIQFRDADGHCLRIIGSSDPVVTTGRPYTEIEAVMDHPELGKVDLTKLTRRFDVRSCMICTNLVWSPGEDGWSEWTPGENAYARCLKGVWETDDIENLASDALRYARSCEHFEVEGFPEESTYPTVKKVQE